MTPTPALAAAVVLVVAIAGREALRVTGWRDRWLRPVTTATIVIALVWSAFAFQRLLTLRAGGL